MGWYIPIKPTKTARSFIYYIQNNAKGSGLTTSIRAKYTVDISFLNIKWEVIDSMNSAKFLMKIV